ncbi:hypothetical protein PR048_025227 [Dryococelus australis]|uniref:C2H2-type domain-containing protein n=1 Tax=Dryococelus australis TaxID=614101 RepID=A0ABQ9GQW0_9NEOP|nr:hypothetical protein PR048_025227 [Dryococelus australis]
MVNFIHRNTVSPSQGPEARVIVGMGNQYLQTQNASDPNVVLRSTNILRICKAAQVVDQRRGQNACLGKSKGWYITLAEREMCQALGWQTCRVTHALPFTTRIHKYLMYPNGSGDSAQSLGLRYRRFNTLENPNHFTGATEPVCQGVIYDTFTKCREGQIPRRNNKPAVLGSCQRVTGIAALFASLLREINIEPMVRERTFIITEATAYLRELMGPKYSLMAVLSAKASSLGDVIIRGFQSQVTSTLYSSRSTDFANDTSSKLLIPQDSEVLQTGSIGFVISSNDDGEDIFLNSLLDLSKQKVWNTRAFFMLFSMGPVNMDNKYAKRILSYYWEQFEILNIVLLCIRSDESCSLCAKAAADTSMDESHPPIHFRQGSACMTRLALQPGACRISIGYYYVHVPSLRLAETCTVPTPLADLLGCLTYFQYATYQSFHCDKCDAVFTRSDILYRHKKQCKGTVCQSSGSECKYCSKTFATILTPDNMKIRQYHFAHRSSELTTLTGLQARIPGNTRPEIFGKSAGCSGRADRPGKKNKQHFKYSVRDSISVPIHLLFATAPVLSALQASMLGNTIPEISGKSTECRGHRGYRSQRGGWRANCHNFGLRHTAAISDCITRPTSVMSLPWLMSWDIDLCPPFWETNTSVKIAMDSPSVVPAAPPSITRSRISCLSTSVLCRESPHPLTQLARTLSLRRSAEPCCTSAGMEFRLEVRLQSSCCNSLDVFALIYGAGERGGLGRSAANLFRGLDYLPGDYDSQDVFEIYVEIIGLTSTKLVYVVRNFYVSRLLQTVNPSALRTLTTLCSAAPPLGCLRNLPASFPSHIYGSPPTTQERRTSLSLVTGYSLEFGPSAHVDGSSSSTPASIRTSHNKCVRTLYKQFILNHCNITRVCVEEGLRRPHAGGASVSDPWHPQHPAVAEGPTNEGVRFLETEGDVSEAWNTERTSRTTPRENLSPFAIPSRDCVQVTESCCLRQQRTSRPRYDVGAARSVRVPGVRLRQLNQWKAKTEKQDYCERTHRTAAKSARCSTCGNPAGTGIALVEGKRYDHYLMCHQKRKVNEGESWEKCECHQQAFLTDHRVVCHCRRVRTFLHYPPPAPKIIAFSLLVLGHSLPNGPDSVSKKRDTCLPMNGECFLLPIRVAALAISRRKAEITGDCSSVVSYARQQCTCTSCICYKSIDCRHGFTEQLNTSSSNDIPRATGRPNCVCGKCSWQANLQQFCLSGRSEGRTVRVWWV